MFFLQLLLCLCHFFVDDLIEQFFQALVLSIELSPVLGDRRDHYTSRTDPWEMFSRILEERKRREIDPTLALLRACVAEAEASGDAHTQERIGQLLGFLETMTRWYEQVRLLPRSVLAKMFALGDRVQQLLKAA